MQGSNWLLYFRTFVLWQVLVWRQHRLGLSPSALSVWSAEDPETICFSTGYLPNLAVPGLPAPAPLPLSVALEAPILSSPPRFPALWSSCPFSLGNGQHLDDAWTLGASLGQWLFTACQSCLLWKPPCAEHLFPSQPISPEFSSSIRLFLSHFEWPVDPRKSFVLLTVGRVAVWATLGSGEELEPSGKGIQTAACTTHEASPSSSA